MENGPKTVTLKFQEGVDVATYFATVSCNLACNFTVFNLIVYVTTNNSTQRSTTGYTSTNSIGIQLP